MAGQVRVNGQVVLKSGAKITQDSSIEVVEAARYVSRGGDKLAGALEHFPLEIENNVCADVGSSTGGFTDCLLQNGARRVYAVDVGKGILHWKLRQDKRVVVLEETNARYLHKLPEYVQIITVDVSFISLKKLLPIFEGWLGGNNKIPGLSGTAQNPSILALIKPQFEAGRREADLGKGVIRDPQVHRKVLVDILGFAIQCGYRAAGLYRSPLSGPKGNIEFFACFELCGLNGNTEGNVWLQGEEELEKMATEVVD